MLIKRKVYLLFCCLCLIQCESTQTDWLPLLQGDWIGQEEALIITIEDQHIVEGEALLTKVPAAFYLEDKEIVIDSIELLRKAQRRKYSYGRRYRIEHLTADSLVLTQYFIGADEKEKRFNLRQLPALGKYQFQELSISSSLCFGACPVFQLRLLADGTCSYQGKQFMEKTGNFMGQLSAEELQLLQIQVDKVDWEAQEENAYWEPIPGQQYFNLEMKDLGGTIYQLSTNTPRSQAVYLLIFKAFRLLEEKSLPTSPQALSFSTDTNKNQKIFQ